MILHTIDAPESYQYEKMASGQWDMTPTYIYTARVPGFLKYHLALNGSQRLWGITKLLDSKHPKAKDILKTFRFVDVTDADLDSVRDHAKGDVYVKDLTARDGNSSVVGYCLLRCMRKYLKARENLDGHAYRLYTKIPANEPPVRDANGKLVGYVSMVGSITCLTDIEY